MYANSTVWFNVNIMINSNLKSIIHNIIDSRKACTGYELPASIEKGSLHEAYEFQSSLVLEMISAGHSSGVGGFKLAVNGKPQMDYFGVEEPCAGVMHKREILSSPASCSASQFMSLAIEPEIAAIMGPGIEEFSGIPTRESMAECIERFVPSIEIIDMRGLQIKDSTLPKAVALNVFNAGCVLGSGSVEPKDLTLDTMTVKLSIDGELIDEKTNNAPQHPLDAVAWLVSHLEHRPFKLKPGMVVLCGTHIPLYSVPERARQIDVSMSGLGTVSMSRTY
jgi:2-keto-4-pentenoate hydratase